ncbi:MAG: class I SAM-dependent rRNA methyltransferase [Oligoflexia bacterium]|nr:class I SAM-dependent rRNA methyltransferase [Oligoflexia bacterium]
MSTVWPIVLISERAWGQIKRGSLWIFSNEFQTKMKAIIPGQWVEFYCRSEYVGFGYVNPHSLITGRICSREKVTDIKQMFTHLITQSLQRRKQFLGTGSFRAVFSECDSLPGLIVDVYEGSCCVALSTTAGMDQARSHWEAALLEVLEPEALVVRGDSSIRHLENIKNFKDVVKGKDIVKSEVDSLKNGQVREGDVLFAADFIDGQKSGFFLDQRENRQHLKKNSSGKTVLDLCSYSGGWGLSALKGGAEHVTFVDQSADALKLVQKGMELNGFDLNRATFITSDVFDYLEKTPVKGKFDIIVADPPAFVKSKKNLPQAVKAYIKLNALAIKRLKYGGVLYSCSCSFHLPEHEFLQVLTESLQKEGRVGTVIYQGGQAPDHPWILNRPESKYLKCLGLQVY